MRLLADGFLLETAAMGAPGIEDVKWARPVTPGDALTSVATVLESRASKSRPDLGLVRFGFEMTEPARRTGVHASQLESDRPARRRRGSERRSPAIRPTDTQAPMRIPAPAAIPYLEDLSPGETQDLGSYTVRGRRHHPLRRLFDPQPFHVDPAAAKESLFGGLCASGWHTAAIWMKLMVAPPGRALAEAAARGPPAARTSGPRPGFKNLKWSKPVYAGDTIAYSSTIAGTRPSGLAAGLGPRLPPQQRREPARRRGVQLRRPGVLGAAALIRAFGLGTQCSVPLEFHQCSHLDAEIAQLAGAAEIRQVDDEAGRDDIRSRSGAGVWWPPWRCRRWRSGRR